MFMYGIKRQLDVHDALRVRDWETLAKLKLQGQSWSDFSEFAVSMLNHLDLTDLVMEASRSKPEIYVSIKLINVELRETSKYMRPVSDMHGACAHQWKRYNGFSESYDYCTFCDTKRK